MRKLPDPQASLFKPMTDSEVSFMERFKIGEMSLQAGTPILSEGANAPQLFTALSGFGLRYKILESGKRQVLSFVLPGDFIGLQAGVMNRQTHSVEATTNMTLCVFNRTELWTLYREHAERAFDLTWIAAGEERFLSEALAAIGQKSAFERIAWAFSRLYRRLEGLKMRQGISVPLPFRQQHLADALGLSLVHTNKTLARLRDQQLATWSDGRLSVPDIEALEAEGLVDEASLRQRPLM